MQRELQRVLMSEAGSLGEALADLQRAVTAVEEAAAGASGAQDEDAFVHSGGSSAAFRVQLSEQVLLLQRQLYALQLFCVSLAALVLLLAWTPSESSTLQLLMALVAVAGAALWYCSAAQPRAPTPQPAPLPSAAAAASAAGLSSGAPIRPFHSWQQPPVRACASPMGRALSFDLPQQRRYQLARRPGSHELQGAKLAVAAAVCAELEEFR